MTLSTKNSEPVRPKLHYCQFDHEGLPRAANYAVAVTDQRDLAANILCAYETRAHPTMPDAIPRRIEQRVARKDGAAGYFYCVSQTGEPLWISASVYPTSKGMIACHFEVSSPLLSHMAAFFAQVSALEKQGLSPDETGARLLTLLTEKDAPDYRGIATQIMVEHLAVRQKGEDRTQYAQLKVFLDILDTLGQIKGYGQDIGGISERSRLIPFQLKLQAARLEGGRGPIGVIAGNHQTLTEHLLSTTQGVREASMTEIDKVADAIAYLAQSCLAAELIENDPAAEAPEVELPPEVAQDLQGVIDDCAANVANVLASITKNTANVIEISNSMRRVLSAMEMTRLMCKIERAKVEGPAEGLGNIVHQLKMVEENLSTVMNQIDDAAKQAREQVTAMTGTTESQVA